MTKPVAASIRPMLRLPAIRPMAKARAGPARRKTRAVSGDHGECEGKCQSGQSDDKQRIGAKVVDNAVHRGDGKCRHGDHAQAVDALTLGLDKGVAGNATDDGRAKSAAGDDRQ